MSPQSFCSASATQAVLEVAIRRARRGKTTLGVLVVRGDSDLGELATYLQGQLRGCDYLGTLDSALVIVLDGLGGPYQVKTAKVRLDRLLDAPGNPLQGPVQSYARVFPDDGLTPDVLIRKC